MIFYYLVKLCFFPGFIFLEHFFKLNLVLHSCYVCAMESSVISHLAVLPSLAFRYLILYYIGRYLLFDIFGGIDSFIFENICDDILRFFFFFGSSIVGINMLSCFFGTYIFIL